ncbi:hypothetical protein [Enterococcus sp. AZ095b]
MDLLPLQTSLVSSTTLHEQKSHVGNQQRSLSGIGIYLTTNTLQGA